MYVFEKIGGNTNYGVPNYTDFYYCGVIVRKETLVDGGTNENGNRATVCNISNMYISKSIWDVKDEVVGYIKKTMMAYELDVGTNIIHILRDPQMVETDYNRK